MHSPKFPAKAADIRKTVEASHLRKLWVSSVRNKMRGQPLPDPVEFLDFHVYAKQRCRDIENAVCAGEYVPSRVIRLKFEKSKGLCRQVVLPSPSDALILQSLSNALWVTIKGKAPSKTAFYAPEDQPFSKNNKGKDENEFGYGTFSAWLDFQREILGFSKRFKFVVVTDIANYYDSIIHAFLRAILSDYASEKEHILDLLLFVLDSMLWRPDYMPNYGIGLPQMDLDAPRLLAHTNLFEVDALLGKDKSIGFARFMDDMDIGVDTVARAKEILRDLDLALQTRNTRLNSGKTRILTAHEASVHFRAKDNERFELFEKSLELQNLPAAKRTILLRGLARAIRLGTATGYFNAGNGEKVLKRLIGLATKNGVSIDQSSFVYILYNRPALREKALRNWSRTGFDAAKIEICTTFLCSGESVDDLSKIQISTYITASRFTAYIPSVFLDNLIDSFKRHDHVGLYCRLWLISRFQTIGQLKHEIDNTSLIWSRHRHLVRLVAGFYGIFKPTMHFATYAPFVRKWGGLEAGGLFDFHDDLSGTQNGFNSVLPFIKSPNISLPNAISHSKSLMLTSLLINASLPKVERAKLLGLNAIMMGDVYYHALFSGIITAAP